MHSPAPFSGPLSLASSLLRAQANLLQDMEAATVATVATVSATEPRSPPRPPRLPEAVLGLALRVQYTMTDLELRRAMTNITNAVEKDDPECPGAPNGKRCWGRQRAARPKRNMRPRSLFEEEEE